MTSAVEEARRGLIRAGSGAPLSAAAAPEGSLSGSSPEEQCALLAEIAAYIGERDPTMIGAARLLEQSGHQRAQLALLPPEGRRRRPHPAGPTTEEEEMQPAATPDIHPTLRSKEVP